MAGPIRNGGIGTATRALAERLAGAGHAVTVLYTLGLYTETEPLDHWVDAYRRAGVTLVPLQEPDLELLAPPASRTSYAVYVWLKAQEPFRLVLFCEWRGAGFFSIEARRCGLAFTQTAMVVVAHSPSFWHLLNNHELLLEPQLLLTDHLERRSVEHADLVISPSAHMFDWMAQEGWPLPERRKVIQNLLPDYLLDSRYPQPRIPHLAAKPAEARSGQPHHIDELVFFGRLEPRKGLRLFCAAIARLQGLTTRPFRVTFLGKSVVAADGFDPQQFLAQESARWAFEWSILSDKNAEEALGYLQGEGRLAIMASLADNSPYTVLECLARGAPFIASAVGGIPELVAEADRAACLFEPTPAALAARLAQALETGAPRPRFAMAPERTLADWLEVVHSLEPARGLIRVGEDPPVTVCLTHFNRPAQLQEALDGLYAQTYRNFDIVVCDDGSDDPEAMAFVDALEAAVTPVPLRVVRRTNGYPGAARNTAVRYAGGEYILFNDDDNIAMPDEIEVLVRAAQASGADIMTPIAARFSTDHPPAGGRTAATALTLPVGGALAYGAIQNEYGDTNALFRRSALEALGGFSEDYGVWHEDWELFSKAALAGYDITPVPEPLFWYRVSPDTRPKTLGRGADLARNIRPYLAGAPSHLGQLVLLAQGLNERLSSRRSDLPSLYAAHRRVIDRMLRAGGQAPGPPSGRRPILAAEAVRVSPSIQATRPLRDLINRRARRPVEAAAPPLETSEEALLYLITVAGSLSWRVTAPLRWLGWRAGGGRR